MKIDKSRATLETLPLAIAIELRKRGVMSEESLAVMNMQAAKSLDRLRLLPERGKDNGNG